MAPTRKTKRNMAEDGEIEQPNMKKMSQSCDAVETTPVKTPSRKSGSKLSSGDGETSPVKAPSRNSETELRDAAERLPVKKRLRKSEKQSCDGGKMELVKMRLSKSEKQSCDGGKMELVKKRSRKLGPRKQLEVVPLKKLLLSALIADDGDEMFGQIGEVGDEWQLDEWILKELRTIGLFRKTVPELAEGDDENTNETERKKAEKCRKQKKDTVAKTSSEGKKKKKPKLKSLLSAYQNDSIAESSPSVKRKMNGEYNRRNKVQETEASTEVGRSSSINAKDEHESSTLETETPSLALPPNDENGADQKAEMVDDFFQLGELDEADKMRTQKDIETWLDIDGAEESDDEFDMEGLPNPPDDLYGVLDNRSWLEF